MAIEQRIYKGDLIQKLMRIHDGLDRLRHYILVNSKANNFGIACEMLESEAVQRNVRLAEAGSDYRWTLVPEKGAR